MTAISVDSGACRRTSPSIVNAILRWSAQASERRRMRKEMRELSVLSSRLPRDVGLEQYAAPRETTIQNP
jgi:uncharacterized protein YjiS (DUF1127 family)